MCECKEFKAHKVVLANQVQYEGKCSAVPDNRTIRFTHMYSISVSLIRTLYSTSRCISETLQHAKWPRTWKFLVTCIFLH